MGKQWDDTGIAFSKETWELALKLLKPGGHLLAFSGSRTYHRMAVAIEDAGFEIRDQIMWLYGSGFPKSLNIGKAIDKKQGNDREDLGNYKTPDGNQELSTYNNWKDGEEQERRTPKTTKGNSEYEGWGTALKPAHEPVVMARKPLSEKTVASNVLKHGTGGINIDGCRVGLSEGDDSRLGGKGTWKTDKMAKDVYVGGYAGEKTGSSELGRFPSNVMHDGSDAVKEVFPKRKTTNRKSRPDDNVFTNENSGMKQEVNHYADADPRGRFPANVMHDGSDVVKEVFPTTSFVDYDDEGSAARYFYSPKVSKKERNQGCDGMPIKKTSSMSGRRDPHEMDKSKIDNDVTGRFVTERKNVHPTVKPVELMKYLCRMVTPKDGTVLDPFMGSGSTGMAAKYEEFDFIGIEREKEYFEIATLRIDSVEVPSTLEKFL
jgi:site-specific DNA-methyltransferase (adenine-specific)